MQITSDVAWRQQVWLVAFSQFIVILGLDMSDPYWPLILSSLHTFSPHTLQYWSGAIYVAPLLTTIFTTLLWAKVGERVGYKKMILRAGLALTATQWGLVFLNNPWLIFMVRLLQGALAGFTTAVQAWSLTVIPSHVHNQVLGRLQAATALGGIMGPLCGGFLLHYCGYASIFFIAGCGCLLISGFLAIFLNERVSSIPRTRVKSENRLSFRKFNKNLLLLLICSTQAARWMSAPFFALYITRGLHASNLLQGFAYAAIALAIAITTPILGRMIDRFPSWPTWSKFCLILALLFSGAVQWGFAFLKKPFLILILSLFWGISLGIISLVLFSFLLKDIHDDNKASTIGLGNTAIKFGNLVGIIAGTVVQAEAHFTVSFMIIGCFYFTLIVLAASYKKRRDVETYAVDFCLQNKE